MVDGRAVRTNKRQSLGSPSHFYYNNFIICCQEKLLSRTILAKYYRFFSEFC
jgi:hypothetical protein